MEETWWSRRSLPGKVGLTILGSFLALIVLGSLLPEPEESTTVARPSPSAVRDPAGEATTAVVPPSPTPSESAPTEPAESSSREPVDASADLGPHGAPERLVLSTGEDADIRAFNDAEKSLASQVAGAVRGEPWWPLVGEVYVDEDMFISDVRIGVDVLYHSDVFDLTLRMCEAFVAALPETDKSLVVHIKLTYVYGGGKAIDGTDEPWEFSYSRTAASGNNFSDGPCEARSLDGPAEERTEAYLAGSR